MAVTGNLYAHALDQALQGKINWTSDTIKLALVTSSYSPNLGSDTYWSTPQSNETSGTGYTAGGVTLSSITHTVTAANSWGTTRANSTAYTYGQLVIPASPNGYLYRCVSAGTSGGSAPSYPTTVGQTVTDSGVTWACAGESVSIYSSAAASWSSSTISAAYGVIYDATPGSASTDPLIALINFGGTVSSTSATFTCTPDSVYGWFNLTPA